MVEQRDKRASKGGSGAPGHVTIDSRGHNVWQWDDHQLDSTTILLRRLDNPELSLEATRTVEQPGPGELQRGAEARSKDQDKRKDENRSIDLTDQGPLLAIEQTIRVKGGGFDPYNRS